MKGLDCLNWTAKSIYGALPYIKEEGFDSIQTSPIQRCKALYSLEPWCVEKEWWKLFQPLGFEIGNHLGTKEEWIQVVEKAHELGIKVYGNVVINHLANLNSDKPYLPSNEVDEVFLEHPEYFKSDKCISNWEDHNECVKLANNLAALDLSNEDVQDIVFEFLNVLVDEIGLDGFRIDALKHIALPEDGSSFLSDLKDKLHNYENLFIYGELIHINIEYLKKYSEYVKPQIHISPEADMYKNEGKTDQIIVMFESADSFLDNQIGWSRKISDEEILNKSEKMCKEFSNWLLYSRSWDFWKRFRF